MRYLRIHTELEIAESDEEVMKTNDNVWPDKELKNKILVPKITEEVISRTEVVYFASFVPDDLIKEARDNGFKIILLDLSMQKLTKRNEERMKVEGYQDASPWFQLQLDTFNRLNKEGLVDVIIDGGKAVESIASDITELAQT